jgi:hypothetical protein
MNRLAQSQETMRSKFLKDTQYKILKNNIKLNYMRDNYTFQIDDFNGSFIIVTKFISKLNNEDVVSYRAILPACYGYQEDCVVFRNKDGSWYRGMIPFISNNCSEEKQEQLRNAIEIYESKKM